MKTIHPLLFLMIIFTSILSNAYCMHPPVLHSVEFNNNSTSSVVIPQYELNDLYFEKNEIPDDLYSRKKSSITIGPGELETIHLAYNYSLSYIFLTCNKENIPTSFKVGEENYYFSIPEEKKYKIHKLTLTEENTILLTYETDDIEKEIFIF